MNSKNVIDRWLEFEKYILLVLQDFFQKLI